MALVGLPLLLVESAVVSCDSFQSCLYDAGIPFEEDSAVQQQYPRVLVPTGHSKQYSHSGETVLE